MKKLSFLIIGAPNSRNTLDLKKEIEKRGHNVHLCSIAEITMNIDVQVNGKDLLLYDIYIFRAYNKSIIFAQLLAIFLTSHHKIVIDHALTERFVASKLHEVLVFKQNDILHPRTYYAHKKSIWPQILQKASFPIVVKPIYGQKGQGVQKIDTLSEALDFFSHNSHFFAQEYLCVSYDIRVLIVGSRIIGAIKRTLVESDFRSTSPKTLKEPYVLTSDEASIALRAHRSLGYDVSGVDILPLNGASYVLEVNSTPQWQVLQKTVGIDVAQHIIQHAINRHQKNKSS